MDFEATPSLLQAYSWGVMLFGFARIGTVMLLHHDMVPCAVFCADCVTHTRGQFGRRRGQLHALSGLLYLCILVWGYLAEASLTQRVTLGVVGICLPLSAASGFGHRGVKNVASGADVCIVVVFCCWNLTYCL